MKSGGNDDLTHTYTNTHNKVTEQFFKDNMTHLGALYKLDKYTLEHSKDVLKLAYLLGRAAEVANEDMDHLLLGAIFHDVGKQFIPQEILCKPGKLTHQEFEVVKEHPKLGYDFMQKNSKLPEPALNIILEHHERIDGTGYPNNIKGKELSYMSKIVSVCDVYSALITDRAYRPAMSTKKALVILDSAKGSQLDSNLVELFKNKVVSEI